MHQENPRETHCGFLEKGDARRHLPPRGHALFKALSAFLIPFTVIPEEARPGAEFHFMGKLRLRESCDLPKVPRLVYGGPWTTTHYRQALVQPCFCFCSTSIPSRCSLPFPTPPPRPGLCVQSVWEGLLPLLLGVPEVLRGLQEARLILPYPSTSHVLGSEHPDLCG